MRTGNPAGVFCPGATMTSNEVLSMYENIADLTDSMVAAAKDGNWEALALLETRCAIEAARASSGVPPLQGAQRLRKVDLLRHIMANDRAVRDVTQPWMGQLQRIMCAH